MEFLGYGMITKVPGLVLKALEFDASAWVKTSQKRPRSRFFPAPLLLLGRGKPALNVKMKRARAGLDANEKTKSAIRRRGTHRARSSRSRRIYI